MTTRWKIAFFTDRRGTGYGGAHYTQSVIRALQLHGFASVEIIGPPDFPQTTIPAVVKITTIKKLVRWCTGNTESLFDFIPRQELLSSHYERQFDLALIDGSLLGSNLSWIRALLPNALTMSVFHNVEVDFIDSQSFLRRPYLILKRLAVQRAERQAAQLDIRIALHAADSERLRALYGKPATYIFPITVDPKPAAIKSEFVEPEGRIVLFVGSSFKPNLDAVAWIYKILAPRISKKIVVVGRGMQVLRRRFPELPNFHIVGSVEDLSPYYRQAELVISPICSGGGMKVKNVEALSYGKKVIASTHSAIGLDRAIDRGYVVVPRTTEEWITEINAYTTDRMPNEKAIAEWCRKEYGFPQNAAALQECLDQELRAFYGR